MTIEKTMRLWHIIPLLLTLGTVVFWNCVPRAIAAENDRPRLTLKAKRFHFLPPRLPGRPLPTKNVRFSGHLRNIESAEDPSDYYCLREVWDFGNGRTSEHSYDCDPWKPGDEIETRFYSYAPYSEPGKHKVRLTLFAGYKRAATATFTFEINQS